MQAAALTNNPSAVTVTPAAPQEMNIVADLAHRIWPICFAHFLSREQIDNMLMRIYNPESLAKQLADGHRFWLASADSLPVGFASAYRDGDAIWLKKLYVLPNQQKGGIGKALMEAAIAGFQPAQTCRLLVNPKNVSAQDFYLRQGFRKTGELPVKMGDFDFIDFIFTKSLFRT